MAAAQSFPTCRSRAARAFALVAVVLSLGQVQAARHLSYNPQVSRRRRILRNSIAQYSVAPGHTRWRRRCPQKLVAGQPPALVQGKAQTVPGPWAQLRSACPSPIRDRGLLPLQDIEYTLKLV